MKYKIQHVLHLPASSSSSVFLVLVGCGVVVVVVGVVVVVAGFDLGALVRDGDPSNKKNCNSQNSAN